MFFLFCLEERNQAGRLVQLVIFRNILLDEIFAFRHIALGNAGHQFSQCFRSIGLIEMAETRKIVNHLTEIGDVGHQGRTAEVDDHFEHAALIDLRVGQKNVLTGAEQMIEFAVVDVTQDCLYKRRLLCFVDEILLIHSSDDDIAFEILLLQDIDSLLKNGDSLGLTQLPEEEEINLIGLHGPLYFRSHFKRINLFGELVTEMRVIDGAPLIAKTVERLKGIFAVADDGWNALLIEGNLLRLSNIFTICASNLEDVVDDDEEVFSTNDANEELVDHAQAKGLIDVGAAVRKTKERKDEKSPGELHHHKELTTMVEVRKERLLSAIG